MVIHRPTQSSEKFEFLYPAEVKKYDTPLSLFTSHIVNKWIFEVNLVSPYLFIYLFCWWFHRLKWHSCTEMLSSVPKHWRLWRPSWWKYLCYVSFTQAWVTAPLAMSLMLTNQQYILNNMSLKRSTHKIWLGIDQLAKCYDRSEAGRNLPLYFPKSGGWVSVNSVFTVTL